MAPKPKKPKMVSVKTSVKSKTPLKETVATSTKSKTPLKNINDKSKKKNKNRNLKKLVLNDYTKILRNRCYLSHQHFVNFSFNLKCFLVQKRKHNKLLR